MYERQLEKSSGQHFLSQDVASESESRLEGSWLSRESTTRTSTTPYSINSNDRERRRSDSANKKRCNDRRGSRSPPDANDGIIVIDDDDQPLPEALEQGQQSERPTRSSTTPSSINSKDQEKIRLDSARKNDHGDRQGSRRPLGINNGSIVREQEDRLLSQPLEQRQQDLPIVPSFLTRLCMSSSLERCSTCPCWRCVLY